MVEREVIVLEAATISIAEISWFIERRGLPQTAKRFADECHDFLKKLSNCELLHKPCFYKKWYELGYRCATFKKKYTIAYSSHENEILIREFVSSKLIA
jgi:hypothetical protein